MQKVKSAVTTALQSERSLTAPHDRNFANGLATANDNGDFVSASYTVSKEMKYESVQQENKVGGQESFLVSGVKVV